MTKVKKLSVSISRDLAVFIDNYKVNQGCNSRSRVIEEALILLREKELEKAYQEADKENDPLWEELAGEGLTDETW